MGKIDFDHAFEGLNAELGKYNAQLHLICAGGYVLQRMGIRGTSDVDAFYRADKAIDEMIFKLGERYEINPASSVWLNNAVAAVCDWPAPQYCRNVYKLSHLTVDEVVPEYLLGMKLLSGRERDVADAVSLLKRLGAQDPIALYHLLRDMAFDLNIVLVLNAFAIAKGEDWVAAYYKAHSAQLLHLLKTDPQHL